LLHRTSQMSLVSNKFFFPYCGILLIMDALLNDLYYCVFKLSRYVDLTILDPKVCYLWFEFYVEFVDLVLHLKVLVLLA
jgi:hypothetical protein